MTHHARAMVIMMLVVAPGIAQGQGDSTVRRLHIGNSRPDTTATPRIPDSVLAAAVAIFNRPGGSRLYGSENVAAGSVIRGPWQVYGGPIRLDGEVVGDVVVINGDLLVTSTGSISGNVTVLGGRLIVDEGARIGGSRVSYQETAHVSRAADNTLVIRQRSRTISELASSNLSVQLGTVAASLDAGVNSYNRVEGLPLRVSTHFAWQRDSRTNVRLDLTGILRTASDPGGVRSNLGWSGQLTTTHTGLSIPFTAGIRARQIVAPMADGAYSSLESGLATVLLHEDYRDWFARKGWGVFADWRLSNTLTAHASYDNNREQTALAADPYSVVRNNEPWRPNPLADDGRFRRLEAGLQIDSRDDSVHTSAGWWLRATLSRVSSSDLSPLSLPTSIRSPLDFTRYASNSLDLDVRRYLQFGPTTSLHLRVLARGWLSGDPLLTQDRHAMGGGDIMPGYEFRAGNCERRRTPDPASPALCDRQAAMQAEWHRELDLNLSTRVGRYTLGLDHPSLILFADAGSAWLSGDTAGRVPNNRIQRLAEWNSDVGVGLDNHWLAVFLAKPLSDSGPLRFQFRLRARF